MKKINYRHGGYRRKIVYINGKAKVEARIVMENHLGRKLLSSELIHHKDHNPLNNNIDNLEIVSRSEHKIIHSNIGKQTRFKAQFKLDLKVISELFKTMNCSEIAFRLGCSQKTISRFVKKNILKNKDLRSFGFKRTKSSYKERNNMEEIKRGPMRHGDVIIVPVGEIKGERQIVDKVVLAYGEVTGHSHQISDGVAHLFKYDEKTYLKVVSEYATLTHEEHHALKLPQGDYEITIQSEWQEDGWFKVLD